MPTKDMPLVGGRAGARQGVPGQSPSEPVQNTAAQRGASELTGRGQSRGLGVDL